MAQDSDNYVYSDLPEVSRTPESATAAYTDGKVPVCDSSLPQAAHPPEQQAHDGAPGPPLPVPWWKRRRWLVFIGAVIVAAIVAGVVAGVVTTKKHGSESTDDAPGTGTSNNTSGRFGTPMNLNAASQDKSRCREFMCPKMIAVAVDESRSTQMVFARGSDSAMYYRRIVGDGWDSGEWESLGGDFSSQPAAAEVRDGAIMVFGVWSLPQEVRVKTFREGRWSGTWDTLNSTSCSAQPYAFNWGVDHVTVLCTQATGHVWWTRFKGSWASEWSDRGSASLGTPAASSGEPGAMVMVTYSKASDTGNYEMIFSRYASEWLDWEGNWGNFKGDPEILGRNATRYDFLGVARSDGSMWHLARISDRDNSTDADDGSRPAKLPSQYTTPYRLGGEWESTPVAVGFSDSRFDVLAVYKNDTLMHRASINDDWGSGWEDLGGYFNSAPAVWVNGSSVVVFGLGPNGKMVHGVFEVDLDTASWGEGKWYNNGGNFSSGGFALTNDPGPEGKKNDS